MKVALISDIHANLAALEAVFADIDGQAGVESVFCLGDVVGYGPCPEECVDLVMQRCAACLLGNHDYALINNAAGFNPVAAGAISCTRKIMEPGSLSLPAKQRRWDWLVNLPERRYLGHDLLVHASPRDNIFEYILPNDTLHSPAKLRDIFSRCAGRLFVGHTHKPGLITERLEYFTPENLRQEYRFSPNEKAIVNVSSVGQPRDRDPRACYAILTDESVLWRRVEYDIKRTADAILANDCLDPRLAERLFEGR